MKALFSSMGLIIALSTTAQAAEEHKGKKSVENKQSVVTVNKTPLSQATYVDALRIQLANGAKDSEGLRKAILDELIVTEALYQEGTKDKLTNDPDVKRAVENAQRKIVAEAYVVKALKAKPITDEEAKAEYDRQIALTQEGRNASEYKTAQIVVKDEATAMAIIKRLKSGEDFTKVAKETSIDTQANQNGGSLPWSLPDQFIKPLGDVVVNLSKGQTVNAPTKTAIGWHIIKLEDTRAFKAPSFEESKARMIQTLTEKRKQEIIQAVMKKTEVKN